MVIRAVACWATLAAVALPARAGEPLAIRVVAFSPDGKLLAAGTGEPKTAGTVTVWDLESQKERWTHREKTGIPGLSFSPDGKTLAIAVYGNAARLLEVDSGKPRQSLPHPMEVRCVAFSPDGKLLATACWDRLIRLWDLETGKEKMTCAGHKDKVFVLAFASSGKRLLSVAGSEGAKLWDAATGAEKSTLKHGQFYVSCGVFSADGRWAITGGYDGTTRVWNPDTGEERARFSGTGGLDDLAHSAQAGKLAVCCDRRLHLFGLNLDEPTAKDHEQIHMLLTRLDDDSYDVREETSQQLLKVGFIAESELRRAAQESKSAEVRIRARRIRQEMLSTPGESLRGHSDRLVTIAFSPDGKVLASAGRDGPIRLWDVANSQEIRRLVPTR